MKGLHMPDHKVTLRLIIAPLTILGFFAVIGFLLYIMALGDEITMNEALKALLLILIGAMARDYGTLMNFCFGSTFGSERKTEIMGGKRDGV